MKRRPFSRLEKRFLIGSALGALLLGGLGVNLMGASTIPPRPPLPTPNGFDLYVAAAKALTVPNPPVDEINDRTNRSPQVAAKIYTSTRRAAWVKANAASWELMRQARAAGTLHPDARDVAFASPRLLSSYGLLRDLARAKSIEAKHFKTLKRPDLALQSGLDTLEMGRDIERGAPMIGSLVGIAVEAIGAASIEDGIAQLAAETAKNGVRRLESIIAGGTSPAEVLCEEKWTLQISAKKTGGWVSRPFTASVGPMMDKFIAQSEKTFALQEMPQRPTGMFNAHAGFIHGLPQRYAFNVARRENLESGLLLRLALRAYRVENGTYPEKLSQLAPKYISKIPRDTFGRGETMRYRKSGDSYLAWSIGPDGKDDDGTPISLKAGKKRLIITDKSIGDAVIRP